MHRSRGSRPNFIVGRKIAILLGLMLICNALLSPAQQPAYAASIAVGCGDSAGLIAAINAANASAGADTITLAAGCTYTLSAANNSGANGPNGLPVLADTLTIEGSGATIARSLAIGTPPFRLIEVAAGSTVALSALALSNGNASTLINGNTSGDGGALFNAGNTTLTGATISNNTAGNGALSNTTAGTLTIDTTTISNNIGNQGGGIYADGNVTITRSTISNNTSTGDGGGLWIAGGTWAITNVTISGNSASGSTNTGGGMVTNYTAPSNVTINNSTIVGNSSIARTGNIDNGAGSVTLRNTIVANPGSGANCVGTTSAGNNLSSDGSCGTIGDRLNTNPLLGPLADNGGPTLTHALLPGSPAIDAGGYMTCAATDQRGISRPQLGICDIGAFEQTPFFLVTNTNDAGPGSLRQAIVDANSRPNFSLPDAIYFSIPGAGMHTIAPLSALPTIIDPVVIDGTTQPGASCAAWPPTLKIELDGSGIISATNGLNIYAGGSTVRGLVMHHFNDAIYLDGLGGNSIQCNFFGTDSTGTEDRGNSIQSGVWVNNIPNNLIGGATPGTGNLFAGTNLEGLRVVGPNASGNLVQGNFIGTNVVGTAGLGSHNWGILVSGSNNRIIQNVIAGAFVRGIWIYSISATGNLVQGNSIGTDASGLARLGNDVGVLVDNDTAGNTIGGSTPGAGNRIANNAGSAVVVKRSTGTRIQHNTIYGNGGPGIDLGDDGVTLNDPGDGDAGPNNLQNTPAISAANIGQGGNLIVQYSVDSLGTNSAYPLQVEFFAADATGTQGRRLLGSDTLAGPGARSANLGSATVLGVAQADRLVATATDNNGNTSEFAAPITVNQVARPARIVLTPPLIPGSHVLVGAPAFAVAGSHTFDILATIIDANGTAAVGFNGPVNLALRAGTGAASATLTGTLTVNAVGGVATFRGLSIDRPGSAYQLLVSAGNAPNTAGAPFDVLEPETDQPSNDTIDGATVLGATPVERAGWISTSDDADWFALDSASTGATVAISLTSLPADYDLALVSDPRARDTTPISDGVSLANSTDASQTDASGRLTSLSLSESFARIGALGRLPGAAQLILNVSANQATDGESILAKLPRSGRYYILVFSAGGAADAIRPYRLSARLVGGTAPPTPPAAQPIGSLPLQRDPAVRTVFLYNAARMRARYPAETADSDQLVANLAPTSRLMSASNGVSIDLGGARGQLSSAALDALNTLYAAWDAPANHAQPAFANQVAQQIWYTLDRAISEAYPGTANIVLVGGDDIIPFYRVPDETVRAPEGEYYQELRATGALAANAPLAGSLQGNFIQTDDFYADRAPTAWRGRLLFVPDQALGRLVERPAEIVSYLNAYAESNYTIDASAPNAAALVTGYDFVADEASQIAAGLNQLGFAPNQQPALDTLINDTWNVDQLTGLWLSGQATRHQLVSFNGHFNHNQLIAANGRSLNASQLQQQPASYFRNALIYAIGCHSGLSASDSAFEGANAAALQNDFAQAVLRAGGNWIGNTGFAYADAKTTGYSQRLAELFTQQIGRPITNTLGYAGAPIGMALVRAKQAYQRAIGPNGFGVGDEKALVQMELYGLPFMRIKVPHPRDIPAPAPQPIPNGLQQAGQFTRLISVTNTFDMVQVGDRQIPRVISVIQDSFKPGTTVLTSTDQLAPGRPVLPALSYDITLRTNPTCSGRCDLPQPRGVQLRAATTLPDANAFAPHVTTTVTDPVNLPRLDPDMTAQGIWLPDLPYTFQRTAALSGTVPITSDRLLISPAQFNASGAGIGHLRRFERMVFEVSYVDPPRVDQQVLKCWVAQSFCDWFSGRTNISNRPPTALARQAGVGAQVQETLVLSTEVRLDKSSLPLLNLNRPQDYISVSATYTVDGINWQRVALSPQGILPAQPGQDFVKVVYLTVVPAPTWPLPYFAAFFEYKDQAGNVKVATPREIPVHRVLLPLAFKQPSPDLAGSISIGPDKRSFTAGEPVQLTVTVTNSGSDAGPFWVDLFINPSAPPTAANTVWNQRCGLRPCFGMAWQVPGGLQAGQSITLTSSQLPPGYSIWPGWFASGTTDLYVYVDSYNPGAAYGAVLEGSESNNQFHLGGLTVTGPNPALLRTQSMRLRR